MSEDLKTLNEAQERIVYYAKVDVEAAEPDVRTKKLYGKSCRLAESGLDLPTIRHYLLKIAEDLDLPKSLADGSITAAYERMVKEGKALDGPAPKPEVGEAVEF